MALAGLELGDTTASAFRMLRLKVCVSTIGLSKLLKKMYLFMYSMLCLHAYQKRDLVHYKRFMSHYVVAGN